MANARDSMFGQPAEKSDRDRAQTPASIVSTASTADKMQDIKRNNPAPNRVDKSQRQEAYGIDPTEDVELAELEVMIKLEKALNRRLNDQAAVFTRRTGSATTSTGSSALSKEVAV